HALHTSAIPLDVFYRFSSEPALHLSIFSSDQNQTCAPSARVRESSSQQQLLQSLISPMISKFISDLFNQGPSRDSRKPSNAALERLAHATTKKSYSPASPLQALVRRRACLVQQLHFITKLGDDDFSHQAFVRGTRYKSFRDNDRFRFV